MKKKLTQMSEIHDIERAEITSYDGFLQREGNR